MVLLLKYYSAKESPFSNNALIYNVLNQKFNIWMYKNLSNSLTHEEKKII
jgi:hypothetical protein